MRILITGAAGFVGKYCIKHFRDNLKWEVFATKLPHEKIAENCSVTDLDLLDKNSALKAIEWSKPDYILHLAAQSSVAVSWKNPQITADINIKGTLNLLDSIRELELKPRIILVGSSEEYGYLPKGVSKVDENTPLHPGNIYAVTKAAQGMIGSVYARAYNLDIMMTRAFNHIGPEQTEIFVASDFCRQTALIEAGKQPSVINVGNLEACRDFTDVRDVVCAYGELLQKGKSGVTYNIGSGKAVSIRSLLDMILSMSQSKIEVKTDKSRLRPLDMPVVEADISLLKKDTGWERKYDLKTTLSEMLDWWREKIRKDN